ncbi:oligogalacturonate lyase family protein [Bacillus sp. JCM 19034]|uniref:oligogalacturonate lyase family protein n=1 Tax=Bacillus sp. JCM 19034 TaxID=1481928 RepID=UPI000780A7F8|nr:oligogalacturonate lyase family protein [Bacillus sp. JCM 19034]
MGKGTKSAAEINTFQDPITGASITQLTDYFAHSFHLYFTNNGWYDNGSKLLLCSDRDNTSNLYSLDIASGELTQLTDLNRNVPKGIHGTYINPHKNEAYFTLEKSIIAIDLQTYKEKVIYTRPDGYNFSNLSCTADGSYLCFGLSEDLSSSINTNLSGGYVALRKRKQLALTAKFVYFY